MAVGFEEPMDAAIATLEPLRDYGPFGEALEHWLAEMDRADHVFMRRALVPDDILSDGIYLVCQPDADHLMWHKLLAGKRSKAAESEQENGR